MPPDGFTGTARFRPLARLGRGSHGAVYRVHDEETGLEVALKTLDSPAPLALYRLKQEFRALAGILHPNLVELYDLVVDDEVSFFTMELVDGVDFVQHVRDRSDGGDGPLDRWLGLSYQLALGVAALHAVERLHRDIKPSNLMVTGDGRVVILDFGLAASLAPVAGERSPAGFAGTLDYMAPEQAWGAAPDPAADWYSVGVVFYQGLTGRLPFVGPPERVLSEKGEAPPPPVSTHRPGISPQLDRLITALLDPRAESRPSGKEVIAELANCGPASIHAAAETRWTARRNETSFVGRFAELERLQDIFSTVRRGQPAVVHLHGPSGIGKTELAARFLTAVDTAGDAWTLAGRCHPQESVPYKALDTLVDVLSQRLVGLPEAELAALMPPDAAALGRLFPVLGRVSAVAQADRSEELRDPSAARRQGFAAVRELLVRLAQRRPLVLWIDDFQWGDLDSVALLREVLRPPTAPALLLLLSYRSDDQGSRSLIEALGSVDDPASGGHTLALGPLDAAEGRELADRLCASQPGATRYLDAILAESNGLPFVIGQLARHVAETAPGSEPDASTLRLATVLHARMEHLSRAARRILETVSVAGHPLDRSVVLGAAGIGEAGRRLLLHLVHAGLVRSTTLSGRAAVEAYHDRIREAVVLQLDPGTARERHLQIAEALTDLADADPQDLFTHFLRAGHASRARPHGMEAAERAAAALAFEQAAQLYRQMLELEVTGPERLALMSKLADALMNGGRGIAAAEVFAAAAGEVAASTPGDLQVLDLKRREAEQYLRAGHLEQGITATRAVFAELGIGYPASPRRAVLSALGLRARLAWRGLKFTPRPPGDIAPAALQRLEACYGAALSLGLADQIVADALSVRHLLESLDVGEVFHVVRALGLEAVKSAQLGGSFMRRRSGRLLAIGEELAADDPVWRAYFLFASGATAYENTAWRSAHEQFEALGALNREPFRGLTFENVTRNSFSLSALAHMGELATVARRLPTVLGDAEERDDLYASVGLRAGILNLVWLAQDRPAHARQQIDAAIAHWPPETAAFHVQHYLHLIADVHIALYTGDVWAAWRRIEASWPHVRKARFLRLESPAIELRNLRARAALAAAVGDRAALPAGAAAPDPRWPRAQLLRAASDEAKKLARVELSSARPFATLIGAGVAHAEGRSEEALGMFARAAAELAAADMALYRAAAQHAGALGGGDAARQLRAEAESWMRGQGIEKPAAMAAVFAPTCGVG